MARFSERIGAKPPKTVLQLDSMDDELRNGLWNVCYDLIFGHFLDNYFNSHEDATVGALWRHFFKLPVDKMPYKGLDIIDWVRGRFFARTWDEVYDLVEFLAGVGPHELPKRLNYILERERSGYRFVGSQLTPVSNEQEVAAIQGAQLQSKLAA